MSSSPSPHRASVGRRLLFALLPVTLLLSGVELAARTLWELPIEFRGEATTRGTLLSPHPTRIWAPPSGPLEQFGATATITDEHLRAVELSGAPLRVLTLGDSSIFGHGLEDADTLHGQLRDALAARGVQADVLCGAIPGYSTEQSLVVMEESGWDLEPDLIIIGNLWSDSNVDNFVDRDWLAALRSPLTRARRLLLQSHAVQFLRPRFQVQSEGAANTYTAVTWVQDPLEVGQRRVPAQEYAENIDALLREAAARGVGAAALLPSNQFRYQADALDVSAGPYFEALRRVSERRGVPVVDTLDALRGSGHGVEELFLDSLHPTALGNGLYAAHLAEILIAEGWPSARLTPDPGPRPFDEAITDPLGGDPESFLQQVRAFAAVLAINAQDPSAAAERCGAIDDHLDRFDCASAAADQLAPDDLPLALKVCDLVDDNALNGACRYFAIQVVGDASLCDQAGSWSALCADRASRRTTPDVSVNDALAIGELEAGVLADLEQRGLPPDHEPTWRVIYDQRLTGLSGAACAAIAEDAPRGRCEEAAYRRADAWCYGFDPSLPDFRESVGVEGSEAWLEGSTHPGEFEDGLLARLAELGVADGHSCTWTRVYGEVLQTEQPVRSARCERAPSAQRGFCYAAFDDVSERLLTQAQRTGALSCEGPLPPRLQHLDDPRFVDTVARWREEGRCGDAPVEPAASSPASGPTRPFGAKPKGGPE